MLNVTLAVEPNHPASVDTGSEASSVKSTARELYSPTTNFAIERDMPVPNQTSFLRRQLEQDLEATQGMNAEVSSEVTSAVQRVLSSVAVGAVTSHIEHNVSTDVPTSAPNNTFTGMSSEGVVATGDSGIDGESTSPSVEGLNTNDDRQPTDQLEKQTPPVIERSPPPRSDPLSARRTVRLSTSSYVIELLPESSC